MPRTGEWKATGYVVQYDRKLFGPYQTRAAAETRAEKAEGAKVVPVYEIRRLSTAVARKTTG